MKLIPGSEYLENGQKENFLTLKISLLSISSLAVKDFINADIYFDVLKQILFIETRAIATF